jgi:hypothetical protein
MPFPNEHAARLLNPNMGKIRVRRTQGSGGGSVQGVQIPSSIDVIWFIVRGEGGRQVPRAQALRFSENRWTATQAKTWLRSKGIKTIGFEAAG